MRHKFGTICLILGFLLILGAGAFAGYNIWDSNRAGKASADILDQLVDQEDEKGIDLLPAEDEQASENESAAAADTPLYKNYPDMEMPVAIIYDYRYIGVLTVPDLGLNLPVMEEWDYSRLRLAPCRFSGSAYTNDMVIAGHDYAAHFHYLKSLPLGSEIIFTDIAGNVFRYTIAWTEILNPEDVDEMISEDENTWDLTLFTCTTDGSSRYTIRCVLEE